jgi:hypothetical protein
MRVVAVVVLLALHQASAGEILGVHEASEDDALLQRLDRGQEVLDRDRDPTVFQVRKNSINIIVRES